MVSSSVGNDLNALTNSLVSNAASILSIVALNISELTPEQAKEYLSEFNDVDEIPSWAILRTAKAKQLDMLIIPPYDTGYVAPLRPATRGEMAGFLVAMMKNAEISPNKKIAGPRYMDGFVLENVYIDKNIAYIPAGTIIPLSVMECMSSKKPFDDSRVAVQGEHFTARATKNFVDKNKVLIRKSLIDFYLKTEADLKINCMFFLRNMIIKLLNLN